MSGDNISMSQFARPIDFAKASADNLILAEIAKQDAMWGETNERADISKGQLYYAAMSQIDIVHSLEVAGFDSEYAVQTAQEFFPPDWGGLRDYGSGVANLVVAAAYLRQEIVRRIRNGESTYRAPRDPVTQPYNPNCTPNPVEP